MSFEVVTEMPKAARKSTSMFTDAPVGQPIKLVRERDFNSKTVSVRSNAYSFAKKNGWKATVVVQDEDTVFVLFSEDTAAAPVEEAKPEPKPRARKRVAKS